MIFAYSSERIKSRSKTLIPHASEQNKESKRGFFLQPGLEHLDGNLGHTAFSSLVLELHELALLDLLSVPSVDITEAFESESESESSAALFVETEDFESDLVESSPKISS